MGKRTETALKTPKGNKKARRDAKNEDSQDDSVQFLGESRPASPPPAPSVGLTVTRQGKPTLYLYSGV